MCGICGKLNFDRHRPVEPELLRSMMDTIEHRGPDGCGRHLSGPVGLGHRRLSIIDVESGKQPISNEDDTIWLVYNGEIYNFKALRTELLAKGHRFRTHSDTEVIVHLYEEMGDACVTRLEGMFAFALWDSKHQHLLLARDRVGIKPLYFSVNHEAIVFASELKAILADSEVDRSIDPEMIDRFLTYHYLPGNQTMFSSIAKLAPGHTLTVDHGRIIHKQYWNLSFDAPAQEQTFEGATETLRTMLSRSVKDHMISDVPVGVLLSGGVDSTGVLHYAAEHSAAPLHSFTMGFSGASFEDERPYAAMAAKKFGTSHHETTISAAEFQEFLPRYVWHMEEPVCEPPAVALYFVARVARQAGVKVLLSGEGGDEAFGGYQDYRNLLALERLKAGFGSARGMLRTGFNALSQMGWSRGQHYAELVDMTVSDYYLSRTSFPNTPFNRAKEQAYGSDFLASLPSVSSDAPTRRLLEQVMHHTPLSRMLYVDTKTWLPDDLLVKADKMTMATSVELRVPLLDHRILEFAATLPEHYKVKGTQLKRLLRAALETSVPEEILKRKKTGFPVPYDTWLRTEMRDFVHDTLFAEDAFVRSCFSMDYVKQVLATHQAGRGHSKEVFTLLVLELWHRCFVREMPALCEA